MTNVSDIIHLIDNLKKYVDAPLKQTILEAYDLYQLLCVISNNYTLYNKLIKLLNIPSSVLNEKIQLRHNILKYFVNSTPLLTVSEQSVLINTSVQIHNTKIKYIVIDNIIVAIHKILPMIEHNSSIQIVVSDYKMRNLIEYAMGIKRYQHDNTQNNGNSEIVKLLNKIAFNNEDAIVVDISHIKYDRDCTIFFNINPDMAWSNNVGHLWLSGREREILGLTTRVNWKTLLCISPSVCIFSETKDMPQWQCIHPGKVEKVEIQYPQIHNYKDEPILNECNELTIDTTGVTNLLHNPYLLYLNNILQLKPKKTYGNDTSKVYNIFSKILRTRTVIPLLNELKEVDYFYYKKIQSFIKDIPQWQYPIKNITIDTLNVIYNDNPQTQIGNTTEINYYTLSASILTKDIIYSKKSGLMLQALSAKNNNIHFNIISPNWHSNDSFNKRTIEVSKEIIQEYRRRIVSAWDNFKCTNIIDLKFDLDIAPVPYKHLERVKQ